MAHAIRIHEVGGPEVLTWEPIELPAPGPGEVRVRHTAIGLNFIDVYYRIGLYPTPLPAVLGTEAVGVIEALGEGVTHFGVGDRVACATGPMGAYTEARNVVASVLVRLPDGVDDRTAAATMLKGMTAHYLLDIGRIRETKPTILVHAAAGGVGLLLCQWAKHLGATVIGTVGSEEKATLARANGCEHVILYRSENVSAKVNELTQGQKVDVVYDSVGNDTFHASLSSLRPRGMMVSFGQSSGPVPAFEPRLLAANGSLFFTRPTLHDYVRKPEELQRRAHDLFEAIMSHILEVRIAQTYPLSDAAKAHRDLEERKTTGSTLLLP
jgi:NADPH:quinone reductase